MTQNTRKTGELLGAELEGVNQILPHMHPWAWQLYLDGAANNWMPTEVPMAKDITNWAKLSDDEKLVVKRNLGFFAGSESLVANNLFALAKHITDPECRQFMARQQYEECYVDGTEVYTQNGWVKFQDLQPNDQVLQYNADGSTEFVNYTNPVARHHDGRIYNLVNINNDTTLLSVTPGHRMIWRHHDGSLKESTAEQIYNSGLQNTNRPNYARKNHITLRGDFEPRLDSQCELVVLDYSGMVYCVTVPSGMLVVRYNGKVSVSGNCLHNHTIVYICDSLDLDINEVYAAYANIPTIKAKDDFLMRATNELNRPNFSTATLQGKRDLYKGAFTYWIICEGIFFYSGFAMLLSMSDKIPGIAEQIAYTLRDETGHIKFGTILLNTLRQQYPDIVDDNFEKELTTLLKEAVRLEIQYAQHVLPRGILGLNSEMFIDYMQYIGNRRLEALGMKYRFDSDKNPFPWLAEKIDIQKQKNFFETRVTDYASASVLDDDF